MKSEWRVSVNPTSDGGYMYGVYRIRDTEAVDHSGNREVFDYYLTEELAQMKADELNRREENRKEAAR